MAGFSGSGTRQLDSRFWYAQARRLSAVSAWITQGALGAILMHRHRNSFRFRVSSSIRFAWYNSWGPCGMHSQNAIRERYYKRYRGLPRVCSLRVVEKIYLYRSLTGGSLHMQIIFAKSDNKTKVLSTLRVQEEAIHLNAPSRMGVPGSAIRTTKHGGEHGELADLTYSWS
jgi:hypothetical protein